MNKHNERQVTNWQSDLPCPDCGTLMNTDGNNYYCPNRNCKDEQKRREREERRNRKNKRDN